MFGVQKCWQCDTRLKILMILQAIVIKYSSPDIKGVNFIVYISFYVLHGMFLRLRLS